MNNLQREILDDYSFSGLAYSFSETIGKVNLEELITQFTWFDLQDGLVTEHSIFRQSNFDKIMIKQPKGKNEFILYIHTRSLDYVLYNENGESKKITANKLEYRKVNVGYVAIPLSINNKVESIELHFMFDVVEKYNLKIEYNDYVEPIINTDEVYKKNISVISRATNNIVNIYFQKATEQVTKTVLKLYLKEDYLINTLIAEANKNYFSINDLTFGKYHFKVLQYDSKDKLIYETTLISFTLESSVQNVYNLNTGRTAISR